MFTHLAPHDYVAMLRLLRRFAKPGTRLFFTLFINERTEGGYGYVDRIVASDNPREEETRALVLPPTGEVPDFLDVPMGEPLIVALYSRPNALRLIEGTGWEILDVSMPVEHIQHHIVCAPET